MFALVDLDVDGTMERAFLAHTDLNVRKNSDLSQIAQHFGVSIADPADFDFFTSRRLPQRAEGAFFNLPIFGRNGISVWIDGWMAKSLIDLLLEFLGNNVFQLFRLCMDFVPAVAEYFRKVEFDQAVVT